MKILRILYNYDKNNVTVLILLSVVRNEITFLIVNV
jgi:hypothetical protein